MACLFGPYNLPRLIVKSWGWERGNFIVLGKTSLVWTWWLVAITCAGFGGQTSISTGLTSDYLAFATSDLGVQLEHNNTDIIKPGYTMVGDNAWVPRQWMATPIPGHWITGVNDAYNFYHSQVRFTIERAFGIFVHQWGTLSRPLSISILKVPPLVMCLMKLHNFCIK